MNLPRQPVNRRPKTILHTESSRGWGGQERRIISEAQALRARGHRVLIACHPESRLYSRAVAAGFTVEPLPFGGPGNLAAWLKLRRLLQQARVDVLNTHSSLDSWVGALAWKSLARSPIWVRTRHLSTPVSAAFPTRWLYNAPAAVITTSRHIKTMLMTRLGVPEHHLFVVPTGIDLKEFAPRPYDPARRAALGLPQGAFLFGTVAVLRSWKGHLHLLAALRRLLAQGGTAALVLVGDGPYRPVIEARIAELQLQPYVHLAGYQEEVANWLALMDAFVFPSYAHEGVPQAVLQALAMEKPVIAAEVGGIPEVIIPGQTGILVPPKDPVGLAQAMAAVMQEREPAQGLARQGRGLVAEGFSVETMAAAIEKLYYTL